MESAFASASAITDQRQKIEQYKHILATVISSNDVVRAKKFIDHGSFAFSLFFVLVYFCNYFNNAWIIGLWHHRSVIRRRSIGGVAAAFADLCARVREIGTRGTKGYCALCTCSDSASCRFVRRTGSFWFCWWRISEKYLLQH